MIYAPILGGIFALLWCLFSYPLRVLTDGYRSRRLFGKLRPLRFRGIRRGGAVLCFLFDFLAAVFCAAVVVIYDCGYLGGSLRLHHVLLALLGASIARLSYRHFLGHILELTFSLLLDLFLYALFFLSMPIRLFFGVICRLFYRLLLIYKEKRDKIKEKRAAVRYRRKELARAKTAYLPHSFFAAEGKSEGEANG